MKTTIYCVAAESLGSGAVNWHLSEVAADQQYESYVADPGFAADTISRFNVDLDDTMSPNVATALADEVMWSAEYEPLRRRIGTDHVHSDSDCCVGA